MATAKMETDKLFKELEPDANEIMFGQKTLPNRPLTMKEESKRKKILLKLVDQKLKFQLVELMRQQVSGQQNNEHKQETSGTNTIPTIYQAMNESKPSHSFNNYQSQSNWSSSGLQHTEGNWPQHYAAAPQSSFHPPHYGTVADASWNNNRNFQPNIQPNLQLGNVPYFHQNRNPNQSFKRKCTENPNSALPSTTVDARIISNNQISTNMPHEVRDRPNQKRLAPCSSLISIDCNPKPPDHPSASNVPQPIPTTDQISQSTNPIAIANSTIGDRTIPRRQRRYGRKKGLKQQTDASTHAEGNVVFRDNFGQRCIGTVTGNATTNGHDLWSEISRLVSSIFRQDANRVEPLSEYEQKLQNKVLIEISTNPFVLRSDKVISQFVSRIKIEEIISKVLRILQQVKQSNAQIQNDFAQRRNALIGDLKTMNEEVNVASEMENLQLIRAKINEVIGPFVSVDMDEAARNKFVSQLMTNPRELETNEAVTKPIPDKVQVMRDIKHILDENMLVRPGKRFYLPIHRTIDVPFAVTIRDNSNQMPEENLKILLDALIAKTDSVVSLIKPKIVDPKFIDGTLVMVCANRKTFDLIKVTISGNFSGKWTGADLIVSPVQIKNPLSRSELKTVLMKFADPQFCHFNDLMIQLKIDNPSFLSRRWELHEPPVGKVIESTEGLYVGVDMESLGPIEQLNRVAVLFKSTVTFEICYDDSERNFLPDHSLLTP